ncbi:hypothetical protein HG530_011093 [Fusarium avenaceum]|nr:hypothetical protein HG530_011093 [Fusarium avenaceum]
MDGIATAISTAMNVHAPPQIGQVQARVGECQYRYKAEYPSLPALPDIHIVTLVNLLDGASVDAVVLVMQRIAADAMRGARASAGQQGRET